MADGYINHRTMSLGIELSLKDRDHLSKLANFIGTNTTLGRRLLKYKNITKKFDMIQTNKTSRKTLPLPIKKFNIHPHKTKNLQKIRIKKDNLFLSFLIGYIDGDGSITKISRKYNNSYRCTLECNVSWLEFLERSIHRLFKILDSPPKNIIYFR
jgi:hypothetical protein